MEDGDRISIKKQLDKKDKEFAIAKAEFHIARSRYPQFAAVRTINKTIKLNKSKGITTSKKEMIEYRKIVSDLTTKLKHTPEWDYFIRVKAERAELQGLYKFCQEFMVE